MLELTEYRIRDGWGNGGKRGSHRLDRIPTGIVDIVEIRTSGDLRRFVPDGEFTSKDFASFSGFSTKSVSYTHLSANLASVKTVTVLHGKGTGALRKALWGYFKSDPRIASFRAGEYGEGDYGVTVLELK